MASDKTDYLRFSAYSLKELITRKLASDTKFTDQVYEGSNLAILIDIVCYMYQCLMYNVNNAAAEAMWSDTQIYENINRLAKLIGYNPKGATVPTAEFAIDNADELDFTECTIPKYSLIDTKQTDDNGKKIIYSTAEDIKLTKSSNSIAMLMYNGVWKMYETIYVASGNEYQTLYLDNLTSDSSKNTFVQSDMIHVYVRSPQDTNQIVQWKYAETGMFIDSSIAGNNIYSNNDEIFSVRLNENKSYEIMFGNGTNGKIPEKGSEIIIFYLDSNGPYGTINVGDVQDAKIKHDSSIFGIDDTTYNSIFYYSNDTKESIDTFSLIKENLKWKNINSSSDGKEEEDTDDIRANGPMSFKNGNRLITANDWEYYIKNRFSDNIIDVACQNNWTYISSFYRWLYNIGNKYHTNPRYYLTKNRIIKYDYIWADAHDSNNVYLWIKTKNDAEIYKDYINKRVQNIKMITQQPVYLTPLNVQFAICAQDVDQVRTQLKAGDTSFTGNYIEITLNDNSVYTNLNIAKQVAQVIKNYFNDSNFTLGATIDNNTIANQIYALGNINRIRTIYTSDVTNDERIFTGIMFASWTSDFIEIGDDIEITSIKTLEKFQFPKLYMTSNIENYIKVIKHSSGNINSIQY